MKVMIATADVPNLNGHVYSRTTLEQAIHDINYICYGKLGMENINWTGSTNLAERSHVIEDLHFEGNQLVGTVLLLPTEQGQLLRTMLESCALDFRIAGTGITHYINDAEVEIKDFKLHSINAVLDGA